MKGAAQFNKPDLFLREQETDKWALEICSCKSNDQTQLFKNRFVNTVADVEM